MPIIDIEKKHLDLVKQILKKVLGENSDIIVFVFGSRIKGNAEKFSDLDLAIFKEGENVPKLVAELLYEFEESDLPFKVDVVDLNETSENFRKAIEKDLVKIEYEKKIPEGWREVRLGEIFELSAGGDIDKDNFSPTKDKIHKYPIYANSLINKGLYGYSTFYTIENDSITISGRGEIGRVFFREGKFTPIVRLITAIPLKGIDAKYMTYACSNIHFKKESTGVPQLTVPQVALYRVLLHPLSERIAITKILSEWDHAIDLVSLKIELKERLKKGLMQRLLTGKVRLKGFNGEWRKEALSYIATINKGQQLGKLQMIDCGTYPVLNGGIDFSGYTDHFNTSENTIAISEGGNSCGFISYIRQKFWSGGHCYTLSNLKINSNFLYQLLKSNEPAIMKLRVGSGLPNIQKSSLENYLLNIPIDLSEQTAIAEVLTTADNEISLLKKQLDNLKLQKKGLMQKLLTGEWLTKNMKINKE